MNQYHQQAENFLKTFGIKCRITLKNAKDAGWSPSGNHYRVTLSAKNRRLSFDFWGSLNDQETGKHPHTYDVLTCVGSDSYCPDTLEDFCAEYGYNSDSVQERKRKSALFRRCLSFSKRIQAFFTKTELEAVREIQ